MNSDYSSSSLRKHIRHTRFVMAMVVIQAFVLSVLVIVPGCKPDAGIDEAGLYGNWDVVHSMRNGKEIPYLRGGYFVIKKDQQMTINITGEEETGSFVLDQRTLRMNDEKDFIIEKMQADSMTIRYVKSAESEFIFYLARKKNEAQ